MIEQPTRRGLLLGLGAAFAAPAIVRATSIMPVRLIRGDVCSLAQMQKSFYDHWRELAELIANPPLVVEPRPLSVIDMRPGAVNYAGVAARHLVSDPYKSA